MSKSTAHTLQTNFWQCLLLPNTAHTRGQPPTWAGSRGSHWQEHFAHSQSHTHIPLLQRDPECAGICLSSPTTQQFQLCFLYHMKPQWSFTSPLLPPVKLQQSVGASKAALESLWESRSNAAPQNLEIRLQLHWADPGYPLRVRRRDGTVIQSQKGSETKVHFRVLSQMAAELMGKLLLTPQP